MPKIHDLARRISVDRAIGYAIAMRTWQVPAGVVTTVLIALYFDETTQGIYYLLLSLIGLTVACRLGARECHDARGQPRVGAAAFGSLRDS